MSTATAPTTTEKQYGLQWVNFVTMTEHPQDVEPLPLEAAKVRVREYNRLGATGTGRYELVSA